MESDNQSKKVLPNEESGAERQSMGSDDQSQKVLPSEESGAERQSMGSDDQSQKVLPNKESGAERESMGSGDQSDKVLPNKESGTECQSMGSNDQSEKVLPNKESGTELQSMSDDPSQKDLLGKESDGERQKMVSEIQPEKDLPRKESNNERLRIESEIQPEKDLPRKESNSERLRMETEDQSKKIFVKITKTIAVDVMNTNKIDAIKTKVQDMERIASSNQELFFCGTHLIDTQTLDYYNIPTNSCIDLYVKEGITISIKSLKKKTISLDVMTSDTVSNIKAMIHDKEGIPSDQQTLIFSRKMLDKDQLLASYGIHNNAVLQMFTRPSSFRHVTVKLIDGSTKNLEVHSWYAIAELKFMVGLPKNGQLKLFLSDQQLDDNKTLLYYKINDSAVIEVRPALYKIFVEFLDEAHVAMNVNANEKLSDVAVRIGERLILDPEKFAIQHLGRFLRNGNSTVGENGIGDRSTLEVKPLTEHKGGCSVL